MDAIVVFGRSDHGSIPRGASRALNLWVDHSDPNFGHCSIYLLTERLNVYVELQCWHSVFKVDLISQDLLLEMIGGMPYTHALRVQRRVNLRPWRCRLGMTCVSVAKHALALDAPWVFTPRQLFRYLVGQQGVTPLI